MSLPHSKTYHMGSRSITCENITAINRPDEATEIITCNDVDNPGQTRIYTFDLRNMYACIEERFHNGEMV